MEDIEWGNSELRSLSERLRQYKAISLAHLKALDPALGALYTSETPKPILDNTLLTDESAEVRPAAAKSEQDDDSPTSSVGMPTTSESVQKMDTKRKIKNAAVLVPLFRGPKGDLRVWLTKRASKMSSHSGEVALPGGKRDEGDVDDASTALREAQEEIGLQPSDVKVVAHLEPFLSKHLLTVVPVVGLLPRGHAFEPTPNLAEVDAVFDAPLHMFLEDRDHEYEDTTWLGIPYRVHFFHYHSGTSHFKVWGLTASILVRAASVVYDEEPAFKEFHPDAPDYGNVMADLAKRNLLDVQ
eukprot:jgi/Mesen1/3199/ME000185S02343